MGSESHGKILSLGESAEFKAGSNTTEGFVNYRKNGVIFVSVTNGKFSGQDSAPGHRRTVGPSVLYDSYGVQMSLLSENKPGLFCLRID